MQAVKRLLGLGRSGPPKLYMAETKFNKDILSRCHTVFQTYQVNPWLWNGHVETIFAAKFRKSLQLKYNRECIIMPDGGTVAVDFEPVEYDKGLPQNAPILILLPGLTGGSHDSYVEYCVLAARLVGLRAIVFNGRGTSDSPVTTPQFYSASFTGDMRGVIQKVKEWYPDSVMFAAGWSLGANILVRYLGEEGSETPIKAAISLCNPFDLDVQVISDRNFQAGFNRIYDVSLALSLRRLFKLYADQFEGLGGEWKPEQAAKCWSIREFDDAITRVCFGWPSVDAYYAGSSSSLSIPDVKIPLLCVQAGDDPIAPESAIPYQAIQANENCILLVTPAGGHLGWVSGPGAPFGAPWSDLVVTEYFKSFLQQAGMEQPAAAIVNNLTRQ